MHPIVKTSILYTGWILLHIVASHVYVKICVPSSIQGVLLAPFMAPAPHCVTIRWVVTISGDSISTMWFILGGAVSFGMFRYMPKR